MIGKSLGHNKIIEKQAQAIQRKGRQ